MSFKIATWNVNSLKVRLPQVLQWLESAKPDVLALQEIKMPDEAFPLAEINQAGYQAVWNGQRTYNGVAILSRQLGTDLVKDIPDLEDPQRRVMGMALNDMYVLNVYVPNGESVDSPKYQYKLGWLQKLHDFLADTLKKYSKVIVLGDFNIAPEAQDVYDPAAWVNSVLFSEKERAALYKLMELGVADCFRLHPQPEKSYSWWDYRLNAFKRNMGLRIDHILASRPLAAECLSCYIDKAPRAAERPSDHAPVVAEFSA